MTWWLALASLAACGQAPDAACAESDRDADGHEDVRCGGDDCDDDDAAVHPGAEDAAGWAPQGVAAGDDYDPSIAFGVANVAWLSFVQRDGEGGTLTIAHEEGATWSSEVADGPSAGWQSSLAVGPDGAWHVLSNTLDATPEVKHAFGSAGAMDREVLGLGADPSVAVGADGRVHAVFRVGQSPDAELVHAVRADAGWTTERVDGPGDTGTGPSLVIDAAGSLRVGFGRVDDASGARQVVVATNAAGSWEVAVVATGQGPVSLALDSHGALHLAYSALNESGIAMGIEHATDAAEGRWTHESIDPNASRDAAPSLAVHPRGWVEVAYLDEDRLVHATNADGQWSTELVDHASALSPPSLAIGRADTAIAFRDPSGAMTVTQSRDLNCDGR